MARWSPEARMTQAAFRNLLDAHLFASMDVDGESRSVLGCSCGKKMRCDQTSHPEHQYREHLAEELEKFAKNALTKGKSGAAQSAETRP